MSSGHEDIQFLKAGAPLFQKGDDGGDLYFIEEGSIEIFIEQEGREVVLSVMKAGEVLGTFTCITKDKRLANARAATDVTLKHVPAEKISLLLEDLPSWMRIVLKDFASRLQSMNAQYSCSLLELEKVRRTQFDWLRTAAQLAEGLAVCAPHKKIMLDDIPGLLQKDVLDYLEPILGRSRKNLEKIFQIFVDSGLITLKIEKEKKRKFFTVENAMKIKDFSFFIDQAKRKKIKHLLEVRFKNREIRVLAAMLRYVVSKDLDLKEEAQLYLSELEKSLEKSTGQVFESSCLIQAEALGMLRTEGLGEHTLIRFSPEKLSHILAHLNAYRKLIKFVPLD